MFSALVKHEMKWRPKNSKANQAWRIRMIFIYFGIAALVGLFFWTRAALAGKLEPIQTWNFLFGLPFAVMGISIGAVSREWKNNTVGWWLSLPYSRLKLIMAKFLACLWRALVIFVVIAVLAILLFLYTLLIDPQLTLADFSDFLLVGVNMAVVLFVVSPLMVSIGMVTAVFARTGYQFLVPLIWIGFWVLWSVAASSYFKQIFGEMKAEYFSMVIPSMIAWIPCWLVAYGLLRFVAYALEKKLNL